jgi:hypothetical protein
MMMEGTLARNPNLLRRLLGKHQSHPMRNHVNGTSPKEEPNKQDQANKTSKAPVVVKLKTPARGVGVSASEELSSTLWVVELRNPQRRRALPYFLALFSPYFLFISPERGRYETMYGSRFFTNFYAVFILFLENIDLRGLRISVAGGSRWHRDS